jgi:flagellar basal body-associated protein FliL
MSDNKFSSNLCTWNVTGDTCRILSVNEREEEVEDDTKAGLPVVAVVVMIVVVTVVLLIAGGIVTILLYRRTKRMRGKKVEQFEDTKACEMEIMPSSITLLDSSEGLKKRISF